jgi:hypothetical protein
MENNLMENNINKFTYSWDQFGYYTVGSNFKTYKKLEAIEEMRRTGIHLEWHFNKPYYEPFDWKKEPTDSLAELYKRRALEIREKYDYIVFWYSGGPDCWCMLKAFLDNDIHIDEIAHYTSLEGDRDTRSVMNEEIFFNAIPQVEKIVAERPGIKHREVDVSNIMKEIYLRNDLKFDYIYNIKGIVSANSFSRSFIREYVDDYRKIMDSGKKMCFLWGAEKPRLLNRNGKYHACFIDVFSETNARLQSLNDQGYYDEWFYWAPSTAAIVAKQCHILMKILKTEPADSAWMEDRQHGAHNPKSITTGKYMRNHIYHTTIYPGWDPHTLVSPKPLNKLIGERDTWFWNQSHESKSSAWYASHGIFELTKQVGPYWLNDPNDITQGIKGCINIYELE